MAAASASVSATIPLGFRRLQSPREFPPKIRLSYRPGYGVGGLQVKNRLGKVSASRVNPSPNPDAVKGTVGDSSSAADGPPLATILAGIVVFLLFCWIVGSIIMWIVGLIVNVPSS